MLRFFDAFWASL